jgi:hypothetical protein
VRRTAGKDAADADQVHASLTDDAKGWRASLIPFFSIVAAAARQLLLSQRGGAQHLLIDREPRFGGIRQDPGGECLQAPFVLARRPRPLRG